MLKTCGLFGVGIASIVAAIDVEYYTLTLGGFAKLLGVIVTIAGLLATIYVKAVRPAKNVVRDRWQEHVAGPWKERGDKIDALIAGEATRLAITRSNGQKMDAAVAKIELVAARQLVLLKYNAQAVVWTDIDGEITAVSEGYSELTGLDTHDAKFEGWRSVIHEDDIDKVSAEWQAVIQHKRHGSIFFRFVHRETKKACKVNADIQTIRSDGGELLGYCSKITPVIVSPLAAQV